MPGPPKDEDMKALALRLDAEFLATQESSGSTGTFVTVIPKELGKTKYLLRVGNIGDSRVLLGSMDGSIVKGPGTDGGLTTDHKPDYPSERERIERTGGTVQNVMGVSRVNGDLAVSRAFGDGAYKQTGGPAQEDHPVSAEPEFTSIEADETNFVMLVCDGISERNFPNNEVVALAAEKLREEVVDPGAAAAAVCRMALERGSQDNLSCMIVMLGGGPMAGQGKELISGPFDAPKHAGFRNAYAAMARHAGLSLVEAVEARYDAAREELSVAEKGCKAEGIVHKLRDELSMYEGGPPKSLAAGSTERSQWFSDWVEKRSAADDDGGKMKPGDPHSKRRPGAPGDDFAGWTRDQMIHMIESNPRVKEIAKAKGINVERLTASRHQQVASGGKLNSILGTHAMLKCCALAVIVLSLLFHFLSSRKSDEALEMF
eukprot:gnl/TRDRNA2_/TRDRNA2_94602_c0_seq1.p1 gnl/TRDRNA2_/TRDRNA2_94602_c0~~gnl/TRDRNA2_/TRDRNA2_94602_c0_seq1.p1  ORF type:complete len:505 (-),score=101.35 gnl/TRDRNA2_/TRDRNA2_94602_c0_seq1:101-1393(-)